MKKLLRDLAYRLHRLWRRDSEPQEPEIGVRSPLRRGPKDRAAAVALEEPKEPQVLRVFGLRIIRKSPE